MAARPAPPDLDACFRHAGIRRTPQRHDVLDYLVSRQVHATADEIFHALNPANPRVSRATVYNSLRALIDAGLVREVLVEGNAARFDATLHRHHHFICDRCGRVEDIDWFDLPSRARKNLGSRSVREYQVVFRGTCRSCA